MPRTYTVCVHSDRESKDGVLVAGEARAREKAQALLDLIIPFDEWVAKNAPSVDKQAIYLCIVCQLQKVASYSGLRGMPG